MPDICTRRGHIFLKNNNIIVMNIYAQNNIKSKHVKKKRLLKYMEKLSETIGKNLTNLSLIGQVNKNTKHVI